MANKHSLFLLILFTATLLAVESRPPFACDPRNPRTRALKFCRVTVPVHVRVRDLIGRLTLQEKIRLLVNNAIDVPRLGIQGYEWWNEALHGVSNAGPGTKFGGAFPAATSFPQVITTAASFNQSLWEQIGRVRFILLFVNILPSLSLIYKILSHLSQKSSLNFLPIYPYIYIHIYRYSLPITGPC
ncbi:putative beta-D-xylosidase [Tripterygium wilfordii]|uniref:Putative beta-D-xylosidase n=1 Tax=Tripterygium wilfordii TaxID=458696 RepID=A0A7J7E0T2_TRIWF|nr:putative beta-D-xylosidase [Tripterygium wilfordii]